MKAVSFTLFITVHFTISFIMYGKNVYSVNPVYNSYMSSDGYEALE